MPSHKTFTLNNTKPVRVGPKSPHSGVVLTVQNLDESEFVYVGVNDKLSTTNYGFKVLPNISISFELSGKDTVFAIGSASSVQVSAVTAGPEDGVQIARTRYNS
jgi:hypothetical protein